MKRRSFIWLILLILLACLAPVVSAQSGARLVFDTVGGDDRTPEVLESDFPRLSMAITPMSDAGVPIGGLTAADFTLLADGAPVRSFTISERMDPNQGISVVLVLDVSGSMRDDIDELRAAAAALYDQVLQQTDESALITFATLADGTSVNLSDPFPQLTAGRESNFTNDEGLLKNLINALLINEGDGTPLYDAIYKGARMARDEAANSRRVVIVMTDGVDADRQGNADQGSIVYDRESVIDELRSLNVPVFTVGLGDELDSAFLQRVANTTGGTYQNAPTSSALADIFTEVASQLKVKYDVTVQSTTLSDGALHNLEISARTSEGTATATTSYQALFPVTPWVQDVQANNPRQVPRSLTEFESLKGRVTLQPNIVARGDIAAVDYYVDDTLVYSANATPWQFVWNTSELLPNEIHRLSIEARDDAEPANAGRADFDLLVEECTIICQLEETTGIPVMYWLIGLVVLLLLFVLLLVLLRRRSRPEPELTYVPPLYTPVAEPAPFMPPVAEPKPTLEMGQTGMGSPADARPRAKTEVLNRAQGPVAFLIDAETSRQFRLNDPTAIGSGADNDVVLDDSAVSGQHAKVKFEDGAFVIFDLASTNGTEVNGVPITRHILTNGDKVKIGRKLLTFKTL
ncbi:MAG: VWA domain-containing protein [Anaerolineales bacterium]|uniref:FHA domain-containing protein n=1 Tax=Promineifilum sp. TaxID=2664178 RepID=UPI001DE30D13|nr:VWA domain-containing protein [Anaerolineales bacterium]MCO5181870.1 VWA domain-containing protein [Promineifilum sp.]